MKKYKILKFIILGFLTRQDQYDERITPESGAILEIVDDIIWVIENGERRESITMASAIDDWLEEGRIEEIQPE